MGLQEQQGDMPLSPEDQARMHRLAEDVNRHLQEMAETVARVLKFPTEGELEVSRIEIVRDVGENDIRVKDCYWVYSSDGQCGVSCDPPGICMMCP
jgi:hypothetical protein